MTQLSQQRIVDAAVQILQSYGLQDLSIRKVAGLLSVQPGALYWHFPHKQALLGAVAEHILNTSASESSGAATANATEGQWSDRCLAVLNDLRYKLLSYRDGAELVSAAFSAESCTIPHIETLASLLEKQNLATVISSQAAAYALIVFALGACVDEQTRSQLAELSDPTKPTAKYVPNDDVFTAGARVFLRGIAAPN